VGIYTLQLGNCVAGKGIFGLTGDKEISVSPKQLPNWSLDPDLFISTEQYIQDIGITVSGQHYEFLEIEQNTFQFSSLDGGPLFCSKQMLEGSEVFGVIGLFKP
jgi:hypothetical protein